MSGQRVSCSCGKILGFVSGRWFYTRHRGRSITASLPVRTQCDGCGKQIITMGEESIE